jgi:hypothetical protein
MAVALSWTRFLWGFGMAACFFVTPMASAAEPPNARYTLSEDGQEVTDSQTKLIWQRCPVGSKWDGKICAGKPTKFNLVQAKKANDPSNSAWRMPTKDEFAALADRSKKKPKMDIVTFPVKPSGLYWALRPENDDNLNAWVVDFRNGKVHGNIRDARYFVRLVRPS